MPIFEYLCRDCNRHFEALVYGSQKAECPQCQSTNIDQQLSVFAVTKGKSSSSAKASTAACGTCGDPRGPGACSLD